MKLITSIFIVLFFFLITTTSIFAQSWYYPMNRYFQRQHLKGFGQFIDDDFYKGKEHRFPYNRFYGYHAAADLEYFPEEKDEEVPVYAVTTGEIKYIDSLQGYGGIILQNIDDGNTALYGHVKITNLSYKLGDEIEAGEILTYLGDEFSKETSKERKHLHFGIYKGTDIYFKGHEASQDALDRKWEDPTKYLMGKGAILPGSQNSKEERTTSSKTIGGQKLNIWDKLTAWVRKLFLFH